MPNRIIGAIPTYRRGPQRQQATGALPRANECSRKKEVIPPQSSTRIRELETARKPRTPVFPDSCFTWTGVVNQNTEGTRRCNLALVAWPPWRPNSAIWTAARRCCAHCRKRVAEGLIGPIPFHNTHRCCHLGDCALYR